MVVTVESCLVDAGEHERHNSETLLDHFSDLAKQVELDTFPPVYHYLHFDRQVVQWS